MAVRISGPKFYAWDENGDPLAFGKVFCYETGSSETFKDTYTGEDQSVVNANPVILNASGYAEIYLDGSYNIVVTDADDVQIWSQDPVSSSSTDVWVFCATPTFISTTSFSIPGDQTAAYSAKSAVRVNNNGSISYSNVVSSSFASSITTVVLADAIVAANITQACVSLVSPESLPSTSSDTFTFDTLADMVAFDLPLNATAITTGRLASGDGGGATYIVEATGTADGFVNHLLDNGRYAILSLNQNLKVEQFGIFTTAADNKAAIDAMLPAIDGLAVDWNKGTYNTSGNHSTAETIQHNGKGINDTIIQLLGTNTGDDMFQLQNESDGTQWNDLKIRGNWDGSTTPSAYGYGVKMVGVASIIGGRNVIVERFTGSAILLAGGIKHDFTNYNLQSCGLDGLTLDGRSTHPITNVTFRGGALQVMRRSLFRHDGFVSGVRFIGTALFIAPILGRFSGNNSAEHVELIGCYVEDITNTPFWVSAGAPLDTEDGGSSQNGTGECISVMATEFLPDAIGRTFIVDTAVYRWTLSALGTNEYYCESVGGGDPSLTQPNQIRFNSRYRTQNAPGALQVGQWAYGDNDSLGFDTVYVRLDDNTDPDTKATGFVEYMKAWEIPNNVATVGRIQIYGCGSLLTRPQNPQGVNDPRVSWEVDYNLQAENLPLAAYPKGVERRLAYNRSSGGNAGRSRAVVEAFNASGFLDDCYIQVDGDSRKWSIGSESIGTLLEGNSIGELLTSVLQLSTTGFLKFGGVAVFSGTGSPEGSKFAPVGSIFLRSDGGASTTLYVKESGTGDTGWVAK